MRVFTSPNTPVPEVQLLVERPIPRDGHQRGRRIQPLEGPGRHALARRQYPRQLGNVLLHPRRGERGVLVDRLSADAQAVEDTTKSIFSEGRAEFRRRDHEYRDPYRNRGVAGR